MIRSELISDAPQKLSSLAGFTSTFTAKFQVALTADLERTIEPNLLAGLQFEPPQRTTYQFSTPKSLRWYFANKVPPYVKGQGRPKGNYKRTHGLSQGYKVRVINGDGAVIMSVSNPANAAQRFAKGKQQTIGHRINGWPADNGIISFWADRAKARVPVVAKELIRQARFS